MTRTVTVECRHCGREAEMTPEVKEYAERATGGRFACSGCIGLEPLTEALRERLPECDTHDCDDPAPFTITNEHGDIHRCRACLRRDLANGLWEFYRPEDAPGG